MGTAAPRPSNMDFNILSIKATMMHQMRKITALVGVLVTFERVATMAHEPRPNRLLATDRAFASQRISKVRLSLRWQFVREKLLVLGSVSLHGGRTMRRWS